MSTNISPLASVDPRAQIDDGVTVGPFCLVGPRVTIGPGTELISHVTVTGRATIGSDNRFYPGAVIGAEPQDLSFRQSDTSVVIGDRNTIREAVTVNRGTEKEDGVTEVGDDCFLMACCHIAHDCKISNRVVIANGTLLGGHVHIHDDVHDDDDVHNDRARPAPFCCTS